MSKSSRQKKRRNKAYTGADAASNQPTVRRYTAVERSRMSEWWHEKKRTIKVVSAISAILLILIWLLFELVRIVF